MITGLKIEVCLYYFDIDLNPKIIIVVNINLKENRYSEYEIKNYLKLLYINQEGLAFKSYENVYKYNMKKKTL